MLLHAHDDTCHAGQGPICKSWEVAFGIVLPQAGMFQHLKHDVICQCGRMSIVIVCNQLFYLKADGATTDTCVQLIDGTRHAASTPQRHWNMTVTAEHVIPTTPPTCHTTICLMHPATRLAQQATSAYDICNLLRITQQLAQSSATTRWSRRTPRIRILCLVPPAL